MRIQLLIIDDFGLKPLRPPADEDLHELIAGRYEAVSAIVTSNLDLTEWDQAFPAIDCSPRPRSSASLFGTAGPAESSQGASGKHSSSGWWKRVRS
jgi:hypothetical protein